MANSKNLREKMQAVEAELRELRDARPKATCSQKAYSRSEDVERALRIEHLEEELAALRKRLGPSR